MIQPTKIEPSPSFNNELNYALEKSAEFIHNLSWVQSKPVRLCYQ